MRPALHFTARRGWINDPHGITWHDGRYEAFFQFVPGRTEWDVGVHWGHATGPDLLSLAETVPALTPGEGDDGIWTGALVVDGDAAHILYTSVLADDLPHGRVRIATADDESWTSWTKGPIVAVEPDGLDITNFRDPVVRREGDRWRMVVGASDATGTALALTYTSPDLRDWRYDGVALSRSSRDREPTWMGSLWECPQIVDIGDGSAMLASVWDDDVLHSAGYATGTFADGRFAATAWGRLTYGDSYYAASVYTDADGRPAVIFWMRGVTDPDAGWAGALSVPYVLDLVGDRLVAAPHPDVLAHRAERAVDGRVESLAADIEWGAGAGVLEITSGDAIVATLRRDEGELRIEIADAAASVVPVDGPVRVIVDGPTLEVSSAAGLFGAAIAPGGGDLRVVGDGVEVWTLS